MKKLLGRIYLTCGGWRQIGEPPREAKCIIVAAPHTSGWDLPPLLGFAWSASFSIFADVLFNDKSSPGDDYVRAVRAGSCN